MIVGEIRQVYGGVRDMPRVLRGFFLFLVIFLIFLIGYATWPLRQRLGGFLLYLWYSKIVVRYSIVGQDQQ
jgi:hypothetical protein